MILQEIYRSRRPPRRRRVETRRNGTCDDEQPDRRIRAARDLQSVPRHRFAVSRLRCGREIRARTARRTPASDARRGIRDSERISVR